jgi:hypothetical protein
MVSAGLAGLESRGQSNPWHPCRCQWNRLHDLP